MQVTNELRCLMDEMITSFRESLFDPRVTDAVMDIVEMGIDTVLVDGVLKEIPFVKTIVALGQFAKNIHDWNLLKQTMEFINSLNRNAISPQKIEEYKNGLLANPQKAEKELSRVMLILNRTIDDEKSRMLARLYLSYIDGRINWPKFCELGEVIERIFIGDIELVIKLSGNTEEVKYGQVGYPGDRLISTGLVQNPTTMSKPGEKIVAGSNLIMMLSELGQDFCLYCL